MKTMTFIFALCVSLIANTALALDVEGVPITDSVTVMGTRTRLTLNGAGIRCGYSSRQRPSAHCAT